MTLLPVHIVAGGLALLAGMAALYAAKGGALHRNSGRTFVGAMLVMTLSAVVIGLMNGRQVNTSQGALTCYLVVTAYFAVKWKASEGRRATIAGMLLAVGLGVYDIKLGLQGLAAPGGLVDGIPGQMMFFFAAIAMVAAAGDLRFLHYLRSAPPPARYRVGRHLWRMGMALWIATVSFFLGQANFIPEPLRILPLLVLPVLLVLGTMLYWIVRVTILGKPWASVPVRRHLPIKKAA